MDESELRTRLQSERDAATARMTALSADLAGMVAAAAGSNLDDEHDPEGATVAFEREQLASLRERLRVRLVDLDAALDRLQAGQYGRCDRCGGEIGAARLQALPAARQCVGCAGAPVR